MTPSPTPDLTPARTCGNCQHWTPPPPRGDNIGYWPGYGGCDAPTPMHARAYDWTDVSADTKATDCPCYQPRQAAPEVSP